MHAETRQYWLPGPLDESNQKPWQSAQTAPDLIVTGWCKVPLSQTLYFRNVNIYGEPNLPAVLLFYEADFPSEGSNTHFWASSIIVENGGELSAYGNDQPKQCLRL